MVWAACGHSLCTSVLVHIEGLSTKVMRTVEVEVCTHLHINAIKVQNRLTLPMGKKTVINHGELYYDKIELAFYSQNS